MFVDAEPLPRSMHGGEGGVRLLVEVLLVEVLVCSSRGIRVRAPSCVGRLPLRPSLL